MLLVLCPYLILTETNTLSVSVPDGKPVIDFIPDMPNILIATGHEGNGLTLVSTDHCINLLQLLVFPCYIIFSV